MLNKKIYFASDFHLGVPDYASSRKREDKIIRWLREVENDAEEIFLVGDLFDFWFEYKHAIPKGFIRLQATIASICDRGIPVHVFIGNHDMWMFDYLPLELGIQLHRVPVERVFGNKTFYIGHGDGLGPGDRKYKFIKKIFRNKFCQWLFARFHPNFGIGLANYFSKKSRNKTKHESTYLGDEREFLVQFCKSELQKKQYDYFVFGHRHLPISMQVSENSQYVNLGDWISYFTYAEFDGEKLLLKKYEE